MNTLLGELATLNDVQFPRYRVAFKFRKLQKNLFFEYGDVGMLTEILHLTGLQALHNGDVVPLSQLSSVLSELYGAIRTARPVLQPSHLQQAQEWAYNWLQLAYKTGAGGQIEATHLKISLCIFMGSKVTDKARFIFGLLANTNGAIERDGLRLFVRILQQLAHAVQENVLEEYQSLDKVFLESLVFVRDSDDVEDEVLDGGIRRQWLSQFEFTKLLSATPAPPFFSWLLLWFAMPAYENVVHSVRCSVCARKPIICFRYQCTQCHNYHMCQMCFLKGRTTDKHQISHKMLEFSNKGRGSNRSWHHRLLGMPHRGLVGGRIVDEERRPFSFRPDPSVGHRNSSSEETDTAVAALTDIMSNSSHLTQPVINGQKRGSHTPAMIRIGSNGKPPFSPKKTPPTSETTTGQGSPLAHRPPAAHTLNTSPARRISEASGSSSPDSLSLSSAGGKSSTEGTQNSPQRGQNQWGERPTIEIKKVLLKQTASDSTVLAVPNRVKDLTDVNRRLSMEVDQILMDLPPPSSSRLPSSSLSHRGHNLHSSQNGHTLHRHDDHSLATNLEGIHKEEKQLQEQVSQLTDKREKLSHELQDLLSQVQQMQVGFQTLGRRTQTSSWARMTSPPAYHVRCDSAPIRSPSPSPSPDGSIPPLNETEVSPEQATLVIRRKKEQEPDYTRHVFTPDLTMPRAPLHDPLSEFQSTDGAADTTDHRYSVAW